MSNVWATMPCVQCSHNMLVNCIDNKQNQLFSEMSLRDVMELPICVYLMDMPSDNIVIRRVSMFYNMLNYGKTDTMFNVQAVAMQECIQLRYRITFISY